MRGCPCPFTAALPGSPPRLPGKRGPDGSPDDKPPPKIANGRGIQAGVARQISMSMDASAITAGVFSCVLV
jgi:hypothetical protein